MVMFAFGTGAGDLVAEHFVLGYIATGILLGTILTSSIFLAAIVGIVINIVTTRESQNRLCQNSHVTKINAASFRAILIPFVAKQRR